MLAILIYVTLFVQLFKSYELCPLEYYVTDENHSYCSQPYPNVVDLQISSSERTAILRIHNHERRLVRGANIEKMYWNDDLAEIALRYARRCEFDHDKASQRSVPRIPLSTGQNLAMGYDNWTQAIGGWIEEKEHYIHGYPATGIVAHYTQMIWHSAVLVGCAATMCPPSGMFDMKWPFYVCNYITGQLNSNLYRPYDQGIEDRPLNDCHGKVCLYNGTLDLKTCQCQCSTYATGSQCEHLNCSILPPCYYQSPESCIAVNVPLECPRLCGLCDRYEVLKQVYGKANLAPNTPAIKMLQTTTITTTTSATKRKPSGRKMKTNSQKRPRKLSLITHPSTVIASNGCNYLPLSIGPYLLYSLMIIIVTLKIFLRN
ncbi:unnamed protein product [Adineta ricciae]|uniref:SCP domain-containing protein n=1 Tax=Adineta ricciae TaxID=249248 RepID=A0A814CPC0_ADIRI|nr:unnamed protein product [Adineta ricciae]